MRDPVVVRDGSGNTTAIVIFGIIVIAAIIGLFVWQPWNTNTHTTTNSTTITQPAAPGGDTGAKSTTTTGSQTTPTKP